MHAVLVIIACLLFTTFGCTGYGDVVLLDLYAYTTKAAARAPARPLKVEVRPFQSSRPIHLVLPPIPGRGPEQSVIGHPKTFLEDQPEPAYQESPGIL